MLAILLLGLLAAAGAAPRYHHPPFDHQPMRGGLDLDDFIRDDLFDTNRFWEQLSRDMRELDAAIAELGRRFPALSSTAAVDGDEYKVTIPLEGFREEDIKVKANAGQLMVQATHGAAGEGAGQRSYLHMMTLPGNVDPLGSWTYSGGVLRIAFPVKREGRPATTTAAPAHSREEMGGGDDDAQDADVGLKRDPHVDTNEIPGARQDAVEATTYSVDLRGDVEFVPVKYPTSEVY